MDALKRIFDAFGMVVGTTMLGAFVFSLFLGWPSDWVERDDGRWEAHSAILSHTGEAQFFEPPPGSGPWYEAWADMGLRLAVVLCPATALGAWVVAGKKPLD